MLKEERTQDRRVFQEQVEGQENGVKGENLNPVPATVAFFGEDANQNWVTFWL